MAAIKSIEEKAKAYDNAFRIAKELYDNPNSSNIGKGYVCTVFPELKESKDEQIRKALIQNLKERFGTKGTMGSILDMPKVLAWLEKQGESDETKAKIFLIDKGYPIDTNGIFPTYEEMYNIIREGLEKQFEQKPAWSEDDENILETLLIKLDNEQDDYPQLSCEFQEIQEFKEWLKSLKKRVQLQ